MKKLKRMFVFVLISGVFSFALSLNHGNDAEDCMAVAETCPNGGTCTTDSETGEYISNCNEDTTGKSQGILNNLLGMWNSYQIWESCRYTDVGKNQNVKGNIGSLCKVGLLMAFLLIVIQLMADFTTNVLGNNVHPIKILQKNLVRVLIIAILLTPDVYMFVANNCVGKVSNQIANGITKHFMGNEGYAKNVKDLVNVIQGKTKKDGQYVKYDRGPLAVKFVTGGVSSVISGIFYFLGVILLLIFPLLQSMIFTLAFYLGPICLPFFVFEVTAGIAKNWFGFLLTAGFWSVVGAITLLVGHSANVTYNMVTGGFEGNFLVMIIYGLLSLILFLMSYPIAASIFGNGGGVTGLMTGSVTMAAGGVAAGAGIAAAVSAQGGFVTGLASKAAGAVGMGGVAAGLGKASQSMNDFAGNMYGQFKKYGSMATHRNFGQGTPTTPGGAQPQPQQGQPAPQTQATPQPQPMSSAPSPSVQQSQTPMPLPPPDSAPRTDRDKNERSIRSQSALAQLKSGRAGGALNGILSALNDTGGAVKDIASINADSNGVRGFTMVDGTQFVNMGNSAFGVMTPSGVIPTASAGGIPTSGGSSADVRMLQAGGGGGQGQALEAALKKLNYDLKDLSHVQKDSSNNITGVTMNTGEQFNRGANGWKPI